MATRIEASRTSYRMAVRRSSHAYETSLTMNPAADIQKNRRAATCQAPACCRKVSR